MKLLRTLVTAFAAVIVAGTVASAAPPLRAAFDVAPTSEVSVSVSPEAPQPTPPPGSESTEAPPPSPSQSETSPPVGDASEGASGSPNFSACAEVTGLDNAICRHEALLALRPENRGLQTSIARLLEIQAGRVEGETTSSTESVTSTSAACPGKSCAPHGNGNGQSKH